MEVQDLQDNYNIGFIRFYRLLIKHSLVGFKQPYSKAEAWLWMLAEARWKEKSEFIDVGGKQRFIKTPRGSYTHSIRFMAKNWGWSIDKVRRYLRYLEKEAMIAQKQVQQITQVSIINYNIYQSNTNGNEYSNQTATKQQPNSINTEQKKEKEIKKEKNIFKPPTYEEINLYCEEKKYNIDIDYFINFYEMKGWIVGKNKMKSWKSAVALATKWEINQDGQNLDGYPKIDLTR